MGMNVIINLGFNCSFSQVEWLYSIHLYWLNKKRFGFCIGWIFVWDLLLCTQGQKYTEICNCSHGFYGHRRQRLGFFGHNDKRYAWRNKAEALKPKNTVPDVNYGIASCSGASLLSVVLVCCTNWMEKRRAISKSTDRHLKLWHSWMFQKDNGKHQH